jgi:hypothetical protein
MIKLKKLLERVEDQPGQFTGIMADWYNFFHRATPVKKIFLARAMIESVHNHQLTPAHVYHIILGLPKPSVLPIYKIAQKHLTPEQLSDVKQQIDTFHQPKDPELSTAAQ